MSNTEQVIPCLSFVLTVCQLWITYQMIVLLDPSVPNDFGFQMDVCLAFYLFILCCNYFLLVLKSQSYIKAKRSNGVNLMNNMYKTDRVNEL